MMKRQTQRGATLIVSLLMLIMMTMLALSSINISNTNLKVIGNMQISRELEAAAQQGIEQMLSDDDYYTASDGSTTTLVGGGDVTVGTYTVTVSEPSCIGSTPATGSGVSFSLVPEDNTWVFTSTVTDSVSGATATITQGTRLRMLAGNCP